MAVVTSSRVYPKGIHGRNARIDRLQVNAYQIPTDFPESDGTLEWTKTILVLVQLTSGDIEGLGYTYADQATARLIETHLAEQIVGHDPMALPQIWEQMVSSVRNMGRWGIAAMAISAVDIALWDLKAKLLGQPLALLLGVYRDQVPVYGSGGFTSYSIPRLRDQLSDWARSGIQRVKMKVGRDPVADPKRVRAAREAIGSKVELFVDANGAYTRKQALAEAQCFAEEGVSWFEEPVPATDLEGLRLFRDRAPAGMDCVAGEYGYALPDFRNLLCAGAVDVLQADVTRCGGITGFLKVGALCDAYQIPFSSHCAPSLHVALGCALPSLRHLEYFHDHVRIEHMLFSGVASPVEGMLSPDLRQPGLGLVFKQEAAAPFAI